jgi:hypothetical protein
VQIPLLQGGFEAARVYRRGRWLARLAGLLIFLLLILAIVLMVLVAIIAIPLAIVWFVGRTVLRALGVLRPKPAPSAFGASNSASEPEVIDADDPARVNVRVKRAEQQVG